MENLNELANNIMDCNKYVAPTVEQAMIFLVSEVGEAADALSRSWQRQFVRNSDKVTDLGEELADVVIMAAITARVANIDLDTAVLDKRDMLMYRFGGHNGSGTNSD